MDKGDLISLELKQFKASGVILYDGVSQLDLKSEIIAIATLKSENIKTGDMIQTWIVNKNINPVEAIKINEDESICGSCIHRGTGEGKNRSCYVNVGQAPLNIWRSYHKGNYILPVDYSFVKNRFLRIGSYGDPVAVPYDVWEPLVKTALGWSAYTHQWRQSDQRFKSICMASVDSVEEYTEAVQKGWRTFRVKGEEEPNLKGEFSCPASPEGGSRRQCLTCLACSGTRFDKIKNGRVSIVVHGSKAKLSGWKNVKQNY